MRMADKSVLGPFWDLASADKDKQLRSAKELIVLLQNCQVNTVLFQITHTLHGVFVPIRCYPDTG